MKKLMAMLTAAFISAASFSAVSAFAQTPEVELPTCTEPADSVAPLYHQFTYDSTAALEKQLRDGFPDEVMTVLDERDGGEFRNFTEWCSGSLAAPMYGGRDIKCDHVSVFSRDLYGLPAIYYTVNDDVFSHIIVQYPFEFTDDQPVLPLTVDEAVKYLYEKSGYTGFDKLEITDIKLGGSETKALIERTEGDSRICVSFLRGHALVCVVLKNDDLSALSDLSIDLRTVMLSSVSGDADNSGELSIADAVVFGRWLVGGGRLGNPDVMDLHRDDRIDVYDLVVLKKLLTGEITPVKPDDPVMPTDPTEPVQPTDPEPTFRDISFDSLADLKAQRESLNSIDEELSGITRAEMEETIEILEKLPVPYIEGSSVSYISRITDHENKTDFAYITFRLPDGEFVRIEYILSEKYAENAIQQAMNENKDIVPVHAYVGDPDDNIKVYAELRTERDGEFTDITWFVKYSDGMYIRPVYHCSDPSWVNTESLMDSVIVTNVKHLAEMS